MNGPIPDKGAGVVYRIEVAGHLDQRWAGLFAGFTIAHDFSDDRRPMTRLIGSVADQAALYGLLNKLRDIGATLLSVQSLKQATP
jgi:hypothetical protein